MTYVEDTRILEGGLRTAHVTYNTLTLFLRATLFFWVAFLFQKLFGCGVEACRLQTWFGACKQTHVHCNVTFVPLCSLQGKQGTHLKQR